MKRIFILLIVAAVGVNANAQTIKTNASTTPPVAAAPAVAREGILTAFESTLVAGQLSLSKVINKGDGQQFETYYTLRNADKLFNNRKPVRIGLSRQSFDSVFTRGAGEIAGKWNILNKYVTDNNISLNDEKGWISVIKYYNSL
jgi:hypothetical protein